MNASLPTISDFDNFLSPGSSMFWKEKSTISSRYLENFSRYGQSCDPLCVGNLRSLQTAYFNPMYIIMHSSYRPKNVTAGTVFAQITNM